MRYGFLGCIELASAYPGSYRKLVTYKSRDISDREAGRGRSRSVTRLNPESDHRIQVNLTLRQLESQTQHQFSNWRVEIRPLG